MEDSLQGDISRPGKEQNKSSLTIISGTKKNSLPPLEEDGHHWSNRRLRNGVKKNASLAECGPSLFGEKPKISQSLPTLPDPLAGNAPRKNRLPPIQSDRANPIIDGTAISNEQPTEKSYDLPKLVGRLECGFDVSELRQRHEVHGTKAGQSACLLDTLSQETQSLAEIVNTLRQQLDMGRVKNNALQQQDMLEYHTDLASIRNSQRKELQDLRSSHLLELEEIGTSINEDAVLSLHTFRRELESTASVLDMERTQRQSDHQRRGEERKQIRDELRRRGGDSKKQRDVKSDGGTKHSGVGKGDGIDQKSISKADKNSRHSRIAMSAKNKLAELACESCDISDALDDLAENSRDDADSEDEEYHCPPGTRGHAIQKMLWKAEVLTRGLYFLPLDVSGYRARLTAHARSSSCQAPRRRGPLKLQPKATVTRVPRGRYR